MKRNWEVVLLETENRPLKVLRLVSWQILQLLALFSRALVNGYLIFYQSLKLIKQKPEDIQRSQCAQEWLRHSTMLTHMEIFFKAPRLSMQRPCKIKVHCPNFGCSFSKSCSFLFSSSTIFKLCNDFHTPLILSCQLFFILGYGLFCKRVAFHCVWFPSPFRPQAQTMRNVSSLVTFFQS